MVLTSTRLGLIACRYLVSNYYENKWASAPEIAERYNMKVRSLMPALRSLTRSGILKSQIGGSEPGFMFSKDPKTISVLNVLTVLEGEFAVECCRDLIRDLRCDCSTSDECCIYSLFNDISETAKRRLARISIAEHSGIIKGGSSV